MKTAKLVISIEKDLKKIFTELAYDLGTTPTNLTNMFIKNFINTGTIHFETKPRRRPTTNLIEIEPFSNEEIELMKNNKILQKNGKKLDKLLANL